MACKEYWEQEVAGKLQGVTQIASSSVSGADYCVQPACSQVINQATGRCLDGHSQDGQQPPISYPAQVDALLCVLQELWDEETWSPSRFHTEFAQLPVVEEVGKLQRGKFLGKAAEVTSLASWLVQQLVMEVERRVEQRPGWEDDPRLAAGRAYLANTEIPVPTPLASAPRHLQGKLYFAVKALVFGEGAITLDWHFLGMSRQDREAFDAWLMSINHSQAGQGTTLSGFRTVIRELADLGVVPVPGRTGPVRLNYFEEIAFVEYEMGELVTVQFEEGDSRHRAVVVDYRYKETEERAGLIYSVELLACDGPVHRNRQRWAWPDRVKDAEDPLVMVKGFRMPGEPCLVIYRAMEPAGENVNGQSTHQTRSLFDGGRFGVIGTRGLHSHREGALQLDAELEGKSWSVERQAMREQEWMRAHDLIVSKHPKLADEEGNSDIDRIEHRQEEFWVYWKTDELARQHSDVSSE